MSTPRPLRVLVIDDMQDILTITSALLQSLSCEVKTSLNATEGLEIFLAQQETGSPIDLILLDIHMPGVDGYAAAANFRSTGFKGKIVAFTANATMQGKKRGKEVGIDQYFNKTVLKRDVIEALLNEVRQGMS